MYSICAAPPLPAMQKPGFIDAVSPIFTHPANAPRLTIVTPIRWRRINAAYLASGLAGPALGDILCSHIVQTMRKIAYLHIYLR